jgi:hypothetical protein
VCQGKKIPPELQLIKAEALEYHKQQQREQRMGRTSRAKCEGCGQQKPVSNCSGRLFCSTCASLAGAATKRLDVLVHMLINRDKGEEALAALAERLSPERVAAVLQPYLPEQVAVELESDTLEQIAQAIGYNNERAEGLIQAVVEMAEALAGYQEERGRHGGFLIALREILGQHIGPVGDLLLEVTRIKRMLEALQGKNEALRDTSEALRAAVGLDSASALHDLVARVQELVNGTRQEAVPSADIIRALGLDPRETVDLAAVNLAILQTAAEAEQVAMDNDYVQGWLDVLAETVGMEMESVGREDFLPLLKTIAHSEAILECLAMQLGAIDPAAIIQAVAALTQANDRTNKQAERLATESTALAERIGELELATTTHEQIFARLREIVDNNHLEPAELPSAIEARLYPVDGCISKLSSSPIASLSNGIRDTVLLDLALDAMRGEITGLDPDRIAMIREAV